MTAEELKERTLFVWEQFGLFTEDRKLDDHLNSVDGVIVIVSHSTVNAADSYQRLATCLRKIQTRPLLVLVEKLPFFFKEDKAPLQACGKDFMVCYPANDKLRQQATRSFAALLSTSQKLAKTSLDMLDAEMCELFAKQLLPIGVWDHYGRLRIVYLALTNHGLEDSINPSGWLCSSWQRYKESIGHGHLWNYSLTRFWVELIHRQMSSAAPKTSFAELFAANADWANGSLHAKYYSQDVIFSERARKEWVPPNLVSTVE
eukprot:TRINITY_DN14296_c0_g1_i1.p1 TRINITY_DN14296_c0_g1~~TRINITY_DN14296_c0_g1_i1.p1  ORF type:complete len:303 (+),score=31.85 TRINITY_DN14296_c0_g1_i1:130-909(+)